LKAGEDFYNQINKKPELFVSVLKNPGYSDAQFNSLLNGVYLAPGLEEKATPNAPKDIKPHQEAVIKALADLHITYVGDLQGRSAQSGQPSVTRKENWTEFPREPDAAFDPDHESVPLLPPKDTPVAQDESRARAPRESVPGKKEVKIHPDPEAGDALAVSIGRRLSIFEYCAGFSAFMPEAKRCLQDWRIPFSAALLQSGYIDALKDQSDAGLLLGALREAGDQRCQKDHAGCGGTGLKLELPRDVAELAFLIARRMLSLGKNPVELGSIFKTPPKSMNELNQQRAEYLHGLQAQ
jgi:hypothetical protein